MNSITHISEEEHIKKELKDIAHYCTKDVAKTLLTGLNPSNNSLEANGIASAWTTFFDDSLDGLKNITKKSVNGKSISWDAYYVPKKNSIGCLFHSNVLQEFKRLSEYDKVNPHSGTTLESPLYGVINRARIMAQMLAYIHNLSHSPEAAQYGLPKVLVGADNVEAFVISSKPFMKYAETNIPKDMTGIQKVINKRHFSPREYFDGCDTNLLNKLANTQLKSMVIYHFDRGSFKNKYAELLRMLLAIKRISQNERPPKTPINKGTLKSVYYWFRDYVFASHQEIQSHVAVHIFLTLIKNHFNYFDNDDENYHIDSNVFTVDNERIKLNRNKLTEFQNKFNCKLQGEDIDNLINSSDTLIKDDERRYKGDFWTPFNWAREARTLIEKNIKPHFMSQCLVWDCACGTHNLTRDQPMRFRHLYCSTYYQTELDESAQFNQNSTSFRYDYLNDDVGNMSHNPKDWILEKRTLNKDRTGHGKNYGLFDALKNAAKNDKTVVFFTNPPYATATNAGAKGTSKPNVAKTKVGYEMKGMSDAKSQLYTQFIYRTCKIIQFFHIKKAYIAFFTKPKFLLGGNRWATFNHYFFSRFTFVNGFLMNAKEFNDTKTWPIMFSLFKLRKKISVKPHLSRSFKFAVKESHLPHNLDPTAIKTIGYHTLRMISRNNSNSLRKWAQDPFNNWKNKKREHIRHSVIKSHPEWNKSRIQKYCNTKFNNLKFSFGQYPQLTSPFNMSKNSKGGKLYHHSLGFLMIKGDNVAEHQRGVWISSASISNSHGFSIIYDETRKTHPCLNRAVVAFAARKTIGSSKWYNDQDNYFKPNETKLKKIGYVNDALVYSLFGNGSYQTAFKWEKYTNIGVPGYWKNKWFWINKNIMASLANNIIATDNFNPMYNIMMQNAKAMSNTPIFTEIKKRDFSQEAKDVLNDSKEVVISSFKYRGIYNNKHPHEGLNCWDAGWYQIYHMCYDLLKHHKINDPKLSNELSKFKNDLKILTHKLRKGIFITNMLTKPLIDIHHDKYDKQTELGKEYKKDDLK